MCEPNYVCTSDLCGGLKVTYIYNYTYNYRREEEREIIYNYYSSHCNTSGRLALSQLDSGWTDYRERRCQFLSASHLLTSSMQSTSEDGQHPEKETTKCRLDDQLTVSQPQVVIHNYIIVMWQRPRSLTQKVLIPI